MRIFLSGPMGSGKSTIAPIVAQRAGITALDLDAAVAAAAGVSVRELFRRGEAAFRDVEGDVLRGLLDRHPACVVALGGGTLVRSDLRRRLLREGIVVTLDADGAELAARVGAGAGRPLLEGRDVGAVLEGLRRERAHVYAECHARIDTSGRTPEAIAQDVLEAARAAPVVVALGERTYRVDVGRGVRRALAMRVTEAVAASAVVVVTDRNVETCWARELREALERDGRRVVAVTLEAGESAKTLASVQRIWDAALDAGIDRGAGIVAVGGGVVGDLAAFAASTLLRGISVGQVPTTLLAMVDSSVGGKTGFDTRHGKNLIGTFHQPRFVLCDTDTLGTLPAVERRSGLAEVAKSAWIRGEDAVRELERDAAALVVGEPDATERAVRMAIALKAQVVEEDERDTNRRAVLNLGHTFGHAIEAAQAYRGLRHGEAVALGMVAAVRVAVGVGRADRAAGERLVALLSALGLPTAFDEHAGSDVMRFVAVDKKRLGEKVGFVVPGAPGIVDVVPQTLRDLERLVFSGAR